MCQLFLCQNKHLCILFKSKTKLLNLFALKHPYKSLLTSIFFPLSFRGECWVLEVNVSPSMKMILCCFYGIIIIVLCSLCYRRLCFNMYWNYNYNLYWHFIIYLYINIVYVYRTNHFLFFSTTLHSFYRMRIIFP